MVCLLKCLNFFLIPGSAAAGEDRGLQSVRSLGPSQARTLVMARALDHVGSLYGLV